MANIFFISDTHLNHSNIIKFKDDNDNWARPHPKTGEQFSSIEEHNEYIINAWNSVVRPGDKVWHLGDVIFGPKDQYAKFIHRLNGKLRLCPGNHDDIKAISGFFEKIEIWRIFKEHKFTCSHIPLNKDCFRHKTQFNVHGHVHTRSLDDPQYINISAEQTGLAPIHLDEILKKIK